MRRREFIALIGGGPVAWPLAARAQAVERVRRIAMLLGLANDRDGQIRVMAFQQRLRELGWVEGKNVSFDIRWAGGDTSVMPAQARQLADLAPDVMFASGTPAVTTLRRAGHSIPIVFAVVTDPIGSGLATNLAKPDRDITGFTNFELSIGGKWLEILKEIAPEITTVGVAFDPASPPEIRSHYKAAIDAAAATFRVGLIDSPVRNGAEIDRVMENLARHRKAGLVVLPDSTTMRYREIITAAAARHGLPAIYPYRYFATSGGLASYGINTIELFQESATYVDRILRGAKAADLPILSPTKFEFVLNLKVAKKLGVVFSPALIA